MLRAEPRLEEENPRAPTGLDTEQLQAEALGNRAASLLLIVPPGPGWVKGAACDGVKERGCCPAIEHVFTLH